MAGQQRRGGCVGSVGSTAASTTGGVDSLLNGGSLLDANINLDANADLAAPVDGAVAANANVAAPVDAAVGANVGSQDSVAEAVAPQEVDIAAEPRSRFGRRHRQAGCQRLPAVGPESNESAAP